MSTVRIPNQTLQLIGIGQIPVMSDAYPMGVVGIQRLRLGTARPSRRGVPNVTEADVTPQLYHVMGLEYILDEAVVLAEVEPVGMVGVVGGFGRYDSGGVLAAVLEDR
eukprot:CAMPEP_0178549830 /NCGR_PEP_ID=MMETSP0697-20121206/5933_1 /TAXON_ID=265572 /ORGANISM="Extubocellulus spinifer, Strain CCMP396" /LENGTH=107 /DNA_ID=CAMNT_0020182587 /DNA_START=59 /DNA_END=382 /DNA_ORIENTATION=+